MELPKCLGIDNDKPGSFKAVTAELDVAICQMTSVDDVAVNVQQILNLLSTLEGPTPDLVCFPENSLYFRIKEGSTIPALDLDDERLRPLMTWAKTRGASLHLGSIPRFGGSGKLFNSSVLIGPDGVARDVYRKIHLFDVDVAGHHPVRESDVFAPGAEPSVIDIKGWKIGCTICYDLRFSELFAVYARAGVDAILIPSAFLVPTGRAHWEILTRARAIESQAYILAAAQGGLHADGRGNSRATYGHSIIVDPWGEVVETLPDDFGEKRVLRARLTRKRITQVRAQIPMSQHRRL